jgi:SAM-dependent methyltransferase
MTGLGTCEKLFFVVIFQPDRHLLQRFMSEHAAPLQGDVLDIGSGVGRYAGCFRHASSYRRLDIDPACQPDILGSVDAIPLPDHCVDVILCSQVLGDVWGLERAVAEMHRVLRPGGTLLLTESLFVELHDEPHDYWRLTEHAWRRLLSSYSDVTIVPRGGFFSMIAQQRIRRAIERWKAYERPLARYCVHLYALLLGHYSLWRDRWDNVSLSRRFPIGYGVIARKRA